MRKELKAKANPKRARILQRFFKTGPGEYGEGDIFLGVTVPEVRKIAKRYGDSGRQDIRKLLHSKVHEERLAALLILVHNFQAGNHKQKESIFDFYLKNTKNINNWDLVDVSADKIVGKYLIDESKEILHKLARSSNLWERRIAIMSTFHFIKNGKFEETLRMSEILLNDSHDLIHKAVGWMLREVGKRSLETEEKFLERYYKNMPRTMLRYAIERFPEETRLAYLKGNI